MRGHCALFTSGAMWDQLHLSSKQALIFFADWIAVSGILLWFSFFGSDKSVQHKNLKVKISVSCYRKIRCLPS